MTDLKQIADKEVSTSHNLSTLNDTSVLNAACIEADKVQKRQKSSV